MWLNTTLESPEKLDLTRFDPRSIRSAECEFGEYGTRDATGHSLTPAENIVQIIGSEGERTVQTTLNTDEAQRFTLKNVFPNWRPDKLTHRLEKQSVRLVKKYL